MTETYIVALADLLNGRVIERAEVGGEVLDLVVLLDTAGEVGVIGSITTGQVALVEVGSPGGVRFDLGGVNAALESDDVLSGDLLRFPTSVLDGGTEGGGEHSSEQEQSLLEGRHCQLLESGKNYSSVKIREPEAV